MNEALRSLAYFVFDLAFMVVIVGLSTLAILFLVECYLDERTPEPTHAARKA